MKTILWLCKNKKDVAIYEEALRLDSIGDSLFVDPYGPKRERENYSFMFFTKDRFNYKLIDLSEDYENMEELIQEASAVFYPIYFDRLHISEKVGNRMSEISRLSVKHGVHAFMLLCDVKFPLVVKYLKKNPAYEEGNGENKNLYPEFFHPDQKLDLVFAATNEDGGLSDSDIYRTFLPAYWRSKNEDGSWSLTEERAGKVQFHYFEWLMLQVEALKAEYLRWLEVEGDAIDTSGPKPIHNFYYGIDRKGVSKSLRGLGLGEDERDAIFGRISKLFPDITDLCDYSSEDRFMPGRWRQFIVQAERVLFPFEKIKTEYQLTARIIEYAYYSGLTSNKPVAIVCDSEVSEATKEILSDRSEASLQRWFKVAKNDAVNFLESIAK